NNPEGGCTFTVSLAEGKITANSRENSPELILSSENPKENSQNEKEEEKTLILVVEDQRELRKFIVENLGDDFRFLEAENGKTGIEMAIAHVPEIIISDVMMPEINGFQLTKTIKENEITSHIPILLLTAKVEQTDVIEGLTVGADDYLVKPFSISELELRIKNRLKQQENLRKKFNQNPYLPKEEETEKLNLIDRNFIEKLDRIVREHIENEIDVSFLSSEIGLSNSQLTRKLKVLIGVTPANFIKNIHLNYALDLLRDGYSVSEASWKSGFSDPAYFSKVFKKHFGFLPSDKEQF
ncbi:MAG: response regulator, partial [Weeksellaceae bacterium]|nr:response regulator [Weeksellaceae bacterium]